MNIVNKLLNKINNYFWKQEERKYIEFIDFLYNTDKGKEDVHYNCKLNKFEIRCNTNLCIACQFERVPYNKKNGLCIWCERELKLNKVKL